MTDVSPSQHCYIFLDYPTFFLFLKNECFSEAGFTDFGLESKFFCVLILTVSLRSFNFNFLGSCFLKTLS